MVNEHLDSLVGPIDSKWLLFLLLKFPYLSQYFLL